MVDQVEFSIKVCIIGNEGLVVLEGVKNWYGEVDVCFLVFFLFFVGQERYFD